MGKVHLKVNGPVNESEVVHEDSEGIASIDKQTEADGMKSLESTEVARLILNGKKSIINYVIGLDDSDYYAINIDEWEFDLSGRNESLPVAIAADLASEKGQYQNSLEALIDWSNDTEFPFSRTAGWMSKRAASDSVMDEIEDWYRDEMMV